MVRRFRKEEGEVVAPPVSKKGIRLREPVRRLPRSGIWRDNFALRTSTARTPEIVSPRRGSRRRASGFQVRGEKWKSGTAASSEPREPQLGYGGVDAGDLDVDGRNDIVWAGTAPG